MKKKLAMVLISIQLIIPTIVLADNTIKITLNGETTKVKEYEPYIDVNSRTMISIRWVAEQLGYKVYWDHETQTATISNNIDTIKVKANHDKVITQDTSIKMDTISVIKNGHLFIPVRFLSECFGFDVKWNSEINMIYLIDPNRILSENETFGVLIPKGIDKSEYEIKKKYYEYYSSIEFYEATSKGLLFTLVCYDLSYWNNEVKDNFSLAYTEIYKDDKNLLICVSASDVQYDSSNIQEKERYKKLWNTIEIVCASTYIFTN